jgi:hypothetical protein
MRIITDYNAGTPTSCSFSSGRGEIEDYTLTVVAQPTCMVPTALTSSAISYQTATIGWTAPTSGTSPAGYEYEVRTSGAAGSGATGLVASGTTTAPTASASLTGLNGGTAYSYYVRSDCGGGDYSSWSSAGSFTTLSCSVPTAITSSAITYTSATIGWTAPATGSPAGYDYEVRTSGTAESGATGLVASGTTTAPTFSANITGLTAGTTYSIYVRSNCYSGFNSSWTSAATFSTLKIEPSNQITALAAGTVTSTGIPLTWTAAIAGTQAPDGYLIKASSVDLNSVTDPVDGTDPANVTVFTSNAANKKQTTGTATSTTTFTGTAPGTMYYYKVYSYTNTGTAIDFNTNSPATLSHATKPNAVSSTLTAETITTSSIGFTWSSTSYLSPTNEYLIFAKAGGAVTIGTPTQDPSLYTASATFGSGTVYQGDANAFCVYKGDGTSVNLSGLSAATTYHFLIYAVVSNANSNGSFSYATGTSVNRTTLCAPISSFPWTEGFENVTTGTTVVGTSTSLPNCWTSQNIKWSTSSEVVYNNANTGTKYLRLGWSSTNAFIWSPGFELTAGVSYDFSFFAQGDGGTGWNADVFVNSTQSSTGATQLGAAITPAGTGTLSIQPYNKVTRTFVPSTTGTYYFTIRGNQASSSPYYMSFDDFKLELTPTCLSPTALTISSITNNSASLSWTAPATAPGSGYDVYYSTTNTAPTAGTTPSASVASGTSYAFTGLTSNTTYYSWVRSNCGASDVSLWVASASFTTLQIPATVPYSTNFNTNDFTFVNGTQTNKWAYGTAVGNTGSSIYVSNDNGVTNAYSNGSSSVVQAYRDIAIPSGATIAQFSFDWLGNAESCCDYTRVWLVPVSFFPTAGSQITSGAGRIQVGSNFNSQTAWQTYTNNSLDISGFANTTMRLVFEWINDGSLGPNPPGAIDNISFKVPYVWTGTTSTDWATTTNWNLGAIPPSTDNIVIPSSGVNIFPVTTSLTIAAGATMTLNANAQLTVNGTLTNNGTLTLESGATLVQDGSGTVAGSGTFNVKQALTGAGGATPSGRFWYLGSPVSTANSGVFNAAGNNRLWTYSETALAYNTEINDNTTALSPMQGAVVRLGADETSIFTGGLLNTGDYTSSLTRTGTTDSKRGYTLLSNPYPSYLDWSAAYTAAAATNANISSSIWYRSHNSTSNTMVFDTYNATGAVATTNSSGTTTQYIPPMQAFWVYNPTDGATGSLTFSNSMRSHQPTGGGLKSSTDFPAFVRLNLENDGAIDQTVLYFDNNAAAGYDNFDSDKMMLANAAQVYSFVDNKKLAINGMKSIKANKQVPLTVEFPTAKGYSFNATEVVMTDGIVILEDRLTKVFQDLTMNPVYNFDAAAGTDANRFVVHFQANSGVAGIETAEDNGIAILSNASGLVTITLSEELPAMGTIQIIDINGKVIATQAINEQTTTMNINAATGVYHVLVDSASKVARKKIVITK